MKCKYTKYSIIELVPFEIKSEKTPLFTIINSLFLWVWLFSYFIYLNFLALFSKSKEISKLYKNKYTSPKKYNEKEFNLLKIESPAQALEMNIQNESIEQISSEVFKGNNAVSILKALIKEKVIESNFDLSILEKIGSIVLRKDVVEINMSEQDCELLNEKIFLVRVISEPVQKFLNIMLYKII